MCVKTYFTHMLVHDQRGSITYKVIRRELTQNLHILVIITTAKKEDINTFCSVCNIYNVNM